MKPVAFVTSIMIGLFFNIGISWSQPTEEIRTDAEWAEFYSRFYLPAAITKDEIAESRNLARIVNASKLSVQQQEGLRLIFDKVLASDIFKFPQMNTEYMLTENMRMLLLSEAIQSLICDEGGKIQQSLIGKYDLETDPIPEVQRVISSTTIVTFKSVPPNAEIVVSKMDQTQVLPKPTDTAFVFRHGSYVVTCTRAGRSSTKHIDVKGDALTVVFDF